MCKTTKDMPDPNDNMMYDRDKGELVWMNRLCSLLYAVGESCTVCTEEQLNFRIVPPHYLTCS